MSRFKVNSIISVKRAIMQHSIPSHKIISLAAPPVAGIVVAAIAVTGLLALVLQQRSTLTVQPITLQCAMDASGSARESLLGPSAATVVRLVSQLDPYRDRLLLYRVDRVTQRICGPDMPESTESLERRLIRQM
jgi:hypothetical protein